SAVLARTPVIRAAVSPRVAVRNGMSSPVLFGAAYARNHGRRSPGPSARGRRSIVGVGLHSRKRQIWMYPSRIEMDGDMKRRPCTNTGAPIHRWVKDEFTRGRRLRSW